jgi:hypothetical protein
MPEYEFDLSEMDSEFDSAERAPKRPSSAPSFKPRPAPGTPSGVTQAQLEAALARVDGKIKTVADGVSTINSRLGSLAVASKKEAEERKKGLDGQNKDLNQKLQMLALLPLLIQPPTGTLGGGATLTDASGNPITPAVVALPDKSSMDQILPLLLVSGLGGTGSSGGGLGFGDGSDGGMLLLALALAFANK